jgi:Uma2 family endonuclease
MTATIEKTEIPGITRPMTYEEYLATPEELARYDILDGYKVYRLYGKEKMASPTRQHQQIQGNLYVLLRQAAREQNLGRAILAPCDVLVRHSPLKVRQPDVMLISSERLEQNAPDDSAVPLDPAPELVVEIISPSERPGARAAKLADYRSVGVREVWQIFSETRMVEIVALTEEAIETVGIYHAGESVVSLIFPNLSASVDAIFEE